MAQETAQLQELIAKLSENTAALKAISARNPEREFAYREGNVGNPDVFNVSEKLEGYVEQLSTSTNNQWVFCSQNYTQKWRVSHRAASNIFPDVFNSFFGICLKLEFDTAPTFPSPDVLFSYYNVATIPTSYTLNAGWTLFDLNIEVALRRRYLRVTSGRFVSASQAFSALSLSTLFNAGYCPLLVNIYGK